MSDGAPELPSKSARQEHAPRSLKWALGLVAAVAAFGASLAVILGWFGIQWPWHDPSSPLRLVSPAPGHLTPQEQCFTISVEGTLPEGKTIIQGTKDLNERRLWFDGNVQPAGKDRWTLQSRIGLEDPDAARSKRKYVVHVYLIDKSLADYLASTNAKPGSTWWSSPGKPPGAEEIGTADVERAEGKGCDSTP